jgi:hypothetical protein
MPRRQRHLVERLAQFISVLLIQHRVLKIRPEGLRQALLVLLLVFASAVTPARKTKQISNIQMPQLREGQVFELFVGE